MVLSPASYRRGVFNESPAPHKYVESRNVVDKIVVLGNMLFNDSVNRIVIAVGQMDPVRGRVVEENEFNEKISSHLDQTLEVVGRLRSPKDVRRTRLIRNKSGRKPVLNMSSNKQPVHREGSIKVEFTTENRRVSNAL